jgi:predicted Zn-dependent protease
MMHDGSRLIEVGWVIVGRIDATDREAVFKARDRLLADLRQTFATFTWRMPIVQREEWSQDFRAEPAALLDYGMAERDVNHWDFAFIVTDVDLVSYYKPYALGALSRSVSVGIISTARLDPQAAHQEATNEERLSVMPRRIAALGLHLFGHLNGLVHDEAVDGYMYNVETVDDLDRLVHFPTAQSKQLEANLHEVADVRLEEESTSARTHPLWFYMQGIWRGRADIAGAIFSKPTSCSSKPNYYAALRLLPSFALTLCST